MAKEVQIPQTKRYRRIPVNDTLMSGAIIDLSVREIMRRVRVDRTHDVPYVAGYSRDGRTIYIDRDLPGSFKTGGRRVRVDRYLILHEAVEKALLDQLGLHYQHAHQIALRTEQAAVRADGVPWREYDRFMQRYIKEAEGHLAKLPADLDIKPYRDEHDRQTLQAIQRALRTGKGRARPKGRGQGKDSAGKPAKGAGR